MVNNQEQQEVAALALDVARDLAPADASPETVIAVAAKVKAFIEGTDAPSSAPATANAEPEVIKATFWRVEYNNRKSAGTHWGKPYKSEKGANKNSKNPAFIRAVKFVETN